MVNVSRQRCVSQGLRKTSTLIRLRCGSVVENGHIIPTFDSSHLLKVWILNLPWMAYVTRQYPHWRPTLNTELEWCFLRILIFVFKVIPENTFYYTTTKALELSMTRVNQNCSG